MYMLPIWLFILSLIIFGPSWPLVALNAAGTRVKSILPEKEKKKEITSRLDPHATRRRELEIWGEAWTECALPTCVECHPPKALAPAEDRSMTMKDGKVTADVISTTPIKSRVQRCRFCNSKFNPLVNKFHLEDCYRKYGDDKYSEIRPKGVPVNAKLSTSYDVFNNELVCDWTFTIDNRTVTYRSTVTKEVIDVISGDGTVVSQIEVYRR